MSKILKTLFLVTIIILILGLPEAKTQEQGHIHAYFCDDVNCTTLYIELIQQAKHVHCAFYELESKKLEQELKQKKASVYIFEDNQNNFATPIPSQGLMHHKFCVFDQDVVITGSYNPIQNQHLDNIIIIQSKTIANNYKQEIERLKGKQPLYTKEILHNNHALQNYFCKEHDCQQKIINEIQQAQNHIYFLTFTFTDNNIANAIINQNVTTKGVIENFQNKQYWTYPLFEQAQQNVSIHSKNYFQHNKVLIIDNTTITGSYNPTRAANTINDENIIIIHNPEITKQYKKKFYEIKQNIKNKRD